MKKFFFLLFIVTLSGCGVNQQTKQIKALEQCQFEVQRIDSVFLAGTDVLKMAQSRQMNLANMSGIGLAMLNQKVPLHAQVLLEIKNPTSNLAGINEFQYQVLMKDQEIATGTFDQQVKINPGETLRVPIGIHSDIYGLLSNQSVLQDMMNFISGKSPNQETLLRFKIKPTIAIGNKAINYPGWITFDRKLNRKALNL